MRKVIIVALANESPLSLVACADEHKVILVALANESPLSLVACANEFHVSADKPIRIPYGDYPYGTHKLPDGRVVFVTQRFDRAAAEAWLAALANEIAAGGLGIPIYHGHPDVDALGHKYPDKRAKGWGNSMTLGEDAAELFIAWNEEPGKGFAYFSPYWVGPAIEQDGRNVLTHMTGWKSIALTNVPNIKEFRLPNESAAGEEKPMNELLKFLVALLKLDPSTTEEQARTAIQKLADDNTALKAAADAAKAEADSAKNAKSETDTALANERRARIDLLLTQAVADGRVSPAGKPAWERNLQGDFDAFAVALANEKPQIKTESVTDARRKAAGGDSVQGKIIALVNEAKAKGLDHDAAWRQVKTDHKELFALQA